MNNRKSNPNESLIKALTVKFNCPIIDAVFDATPLHGGTLGDVKLISGMAFISGEEKVPFKIVHKTQKKWERKFDADSWRREYDLYEGGMDSLFNESLRPPKCYLKEMTADEVQIWIEYIEGVTGPQLTAAMYERAAGEIGRFQGRIHSQREVVTKNVSNLSEIDFLKQNYLGYRSWKEVYDCIRSENCGIPAHLCKMLVDIDNQFDTIWEEIESLPVVFCHRDFWITNIFYVNETIRLIDWDTAGWGYLGEDIASLIADEADVNHMTEYYKRCVPAYYKGFSEYVTLPSGSKNFIWEMMVIKFGYRLIEWYQFANTTEEKQLQIQTLQQIYEMKNM